MVRTSLLSFVLLVSLTAHASAARRGKAKNAVRRDKVTSPPTSRPEPTKAEEKLVDSSTLSPDAAPSAPRTAKPRVYTFGGLDVEGKLKTPQLLYFRSRMKQELDTSGTEKRSFLKELEKTADERGL